ncbi:MAG TPA: NmrA family NAD(P)-binding protein [Pseudorhodoplanes sp.]|nr:NmrA family NAD(P)-binding protein [Pseudorhodoplanes sp.]
MILVTGATGHFGGKAVEALLAMAPARQLAVSVRVPEKASALQVRGVDVRRGDFDDPASLNAAFSGVDRLLIVSTDGDDDTRIRQHIAAVAAAKAKGVGFLAYTSIANADTTPLSLGDVHRATERAIRATGIPFCFLRNNWYIENETPVFQGVLAGAPIATSAADGRVGWAAREDYAQAAAAVLAGQGHDNAIYELSGPPITYGDLAAILSRILGHDVPVRRVNDAAFEDIMSEAGLPEFVVSLLVDIHRSIRKGALDVRSDDLGRLLGRPVTALNDVVERIVKGLPPPPEEARSASPENAPHPHA